MIYNKTAVQLAAVMYLPLIARKRELNSPLFVKVTGKMAYMTTVSAFAILNMQELAQEVRPVVDESSVKSNGVYFIYPDTYLISNISERHSLGTYEGAKSICTIEVDAADYSTIIKSLEELVNQSEFTQRVLAAIQSDSEITAHYCKSECRVCRCTFAKILVDVERIFKKVGVISDVQKLFTIEGV